jgi:hypothetical protein
VSLVALAIGQSVEKRHYLRVKPLLLLFRLLRTLQHKMERNLDVNDRTAGGGAPGNELWCYW